MSYYSELRSYVMHPGQKLPYLPPISYTTRAIIEETFKQVPPALEATIATLHDHKRAIDYETLKQTVLYIGAFTLGAVGINAVATTFFRGLAWPALLGITCASSAAIALFRAQHDPWSSYTLQVFSEIAEFRSHFTTQQSESVISSILKKISLMSSATNPEQRVRLPTYTKAIEEVQGAHGFFLENDSRSRIDRGPKPVHALH